MFALTRHDACHSHRPPLVLAIQQNASVADIREFLASGEDAGHVDGQGQTMLHYAVQYEDDEVLQLLLDLKCAEIHAADRDGSSTMRHACGMSPTDDAHFLTVFLLQQGFSCLSLWGQTSM